VFVVGDFSFVHWFLFRPFPLVVLGLRAIVPVVMCVIVPYYVCVIIPYCARRASTTCFVVIGQFFSRASLSLAVLFSVCVYVCLCTPGTVLVLLRVCNTQPIHIRDSGSQTGLSHDVT
jgi:hypothetical protein